MNKKIDIKEIIPDVDNSIKKYIYGEDNIIDEIANKISATFKWVIERNATNIIDKDKELKDFIRSQKELQREYSRKSSLKEMIDDLTEKQAKILWFFRGCKQNQSIEEEKDDYYSAKRYISFLLADMILQTCRKKKICPNLSLKPEYIEFLQGLTIEEFVRFKAYLKWHDRNKGKYIKDYELHNEDYLKTMGFLDGSMINCKNKQCQDSMLFWKKIFEDKKIKDKSEIFEMIKNAKINSLRRLFRDNQDEFNYVEEFITNFYKYLLKIFDEKEGSCSIIKDIIDCIYEKPDIINMFEFILKCFLLSKLNPIEHNYIRKKNKKDIIKLILN